MARRTAVLFALSTLVSARDSRAQEAVFPSHDVNITIAVGHGAATVLEDYTLVGTIADPAFEFLATPCSVVGAVSATAGDRVLSFARDQLSRRPWTSLRPVASDVSGALYQLRYTVETHGTDPSVPVVLPSTVLDRAGGSRGAHVIITLTFRDEDSGARVLMPQLDRTGSGVWTGSFLAIPSFVRVRIPSADPSGCVAASSVGSSGGLEARFVVFVATMAMWVPMYLWWFARRRWPRTT